MLCKPAAIAAACLALGPMPAASAEVQFNGELRMGVISAPATAEDPGKRIRFFNDIRLRATLQTTTDTGLTIGATVRIDQANQPGIGR